MTVWYPYNAKREYEQVMVAWVQQLLNSPTCFPRWGWSPAEFVPAVVPFLDAHLRGPSKLQLLTTGAGGWLAWSGDEAALAVGEEAILQVTPGSAVWHGGVPGTVVRPWRVFTAAPVLSTSAAARRRQAKALVACENQGLL